MNREQARERLRELCRLEDDWFTLRPADDPDRFTVEAGFGGAADVVLSERWIEVCAIRPLDRLMQAAGESVRGRGALLCATMLPRDPRRVAFRGRVYLDGFTEHAFFVMAGEVLQLAGPATEGERADRPQAHDGGQDTAAVAITTAAAVAEVDAIEAAPAAIGVEPSEPEPEPEPEPVDQLAETATAEPEPPESRAPEAMAAIAAAAGSEPPPAGGVPDTYPGLRVHPVEESSAADRATPVISEPTPPEREIAATVQIPRGELMQEPAPPVVAGPRPCPVCGEAVQPGERFCIGCGAQIPPDFFAQAAPPSGWSRPTGSSSGGQPAAPAAQTVECPHCHFVNPIANRFCQGCGSRLAG